MNNRKKTNDTTLIEDIKNGDSNAFNYLMDTYYNKLCYYANNLVNDVEASEDIVQNVYIKVWTKRKKIKFTTSIQNYLYKAVYNEFIDLKRKPNKYVALEKSHINAINQVIEKKDDDFELMIDILNREIECLPSKCKQVFILNKKDGLTHLEISKHLNISIKTVEGHITRAFKILNKKLKGKINPILFLILKKM